MAADLVRLLFNHVVSGLSIFCRSKSSKKPTMPPKVSQEAPLFEQSSNVLWPNFGKGKPLSFGHQSMSPVSMLKNPSPAPFPISATGLKKMFPRNDGPIPLQGLETCSLHRESKSLSSGILHKRMKLSKSTKRLRGPPKATKSLPFNKAFVQQKDWIAEALLPHLRITLEMLKAFLTKFK